MSATARVPITGEQRAAMARETRTALRRGEMLAAAAEIAADRRAVDLAEQLVEAAWQLLHHLAGSGERRPRRTSRAAVPAGKGRRGGLY